MGKRSEPWIVASASSLGNAQPIEPPNFPHAVLRSTIARQHYQQDNCDDHDWHQK
jgi:hypothetical protein